VNSAHIWTRGGAFVRRLKPGLRRFAALAGTRARVEDWKQEGIGLRRRVLITAIAFLWAVVALTGYLISRGQHSLIEFQAVQLAEIVTRQSASSRSVYAEHVVGKLTRDGVGVASEHYKEERGNVPLPAQFLKLVGERVSVDSRGLYRYRPMSSGIWPPTRDFPTTSSAGPGRSSRLRTNRRRRRRSPGTRSGASRPSKGSARCATCAPTRPSARPA
jgi:hypothetical protein